MVIIFESVLMLFTENIKISKCRKYSLLKLAHVLGQCR